MRPINSAQRTATILRFLLCYVTMLLVVGFLLYLSLIEVPKRQNELTAVTNEQVEKLIRHTDDADTLVIQIQKATEVKAEALAPLFKWTGDLQTAYQQPFYKSIISSYVDLFNEIVKSKTADTTLASLKTRMTILQKENLELMKQHGELKDELTAAKMKHN
ncbi:hypothetical protein [Dyadobacter aurulentus]|uniref:hypothetical protein n=1 Tax=Dyadobacter sp. UC 10 TaxID=2605428 RepID=UPI0011F309E7|nr:hypothetical protein [Dyadobacter sp. UC 10]KAA0989268.1 hypothetical protein FXO21_03375 [Dyadobacter sp. UC 10]